MDISFFWIAAGLAALGYFIGDGLKNFGNPKASFSDYPTLVKEKDLHLHVGLSKEEVSELLHKFPEAPKVELKGATYYPYQRFMEWMSSGEIYKK
ncbi:MAG: DNA-binding protein [Bacillota bacterium]